MSSPVLDEAWRRFAIYDQNAVYMQRSFLRSRICAAALGVLATVLAVVYSLLPKEHGIAGPPFYERLLRILVIAAPISGGVVAAALTRLDRGVAWVQVRGGAEAIKREVFRYRMRVGPYAQAGRDAKEKRDQVLAAQIESVTEHMLDSGVILATLKPYKKSELPPANALALDDDGTSDLTGERYVAVRLQDQLTYYQKRASAFESQHSRLHWLIASFGGIGTLLAALGQEIWVPVCISLAGALGAYLEMQRVETWLATYSRSMVGLEKIVLWWGALSEDGQAHAENIEQLVGRTEMILRTENADWQLGMHDALEEMREDAKK